MKTNYLLWIKIDCSWGFALCCVVLCYKWLHQVKYSLTKRSFSTLHLWATSKITNILYTVLQAQVLVWWLPWWQTQTPPPAGWSPCPVFPPRAGFPPLPLWVDEQLVPAETWCLSGSWSLWRIHPELWCRGLWWISEKYYDTLLVILQRCTVCVEVDNFHSCHLDQKSLLSTIEIRVIMSSITCNILFCKLTCKEKHTHTQMQHIFLEDTKNLSIISYWNNWQWYFQRMAVYFQHDTNEYFSTIPLFTFIWHEAYSYSKYSRQLSILTNYDHEVLNLNSENVLDDVTAGFYQVFKQEGGGDFFSNYKV